MQIRLFTDTPLVCGTDVVFDDTRHHYLRNVLRAEAGATLFLFNGKDGEFEATLTAVDKKRSVANISKQTKPQEYPTPVCLCFAPLKRDCTDWLVEKATELGATIIQPVVTEFTSAARINEDRLRAIAVEAAEQSRRLTVPEIRPMVSLNALIESMKESDGVLFHADESENTVSLKQAFNALPANVPVSFLIGPEGGFSQKERDLLKRQPFVRCVTLGTHILRAETAAAAVLSAWLCR